MTGREFDDPQFDDAEFNYLDDLDEDVGEDFPAEWVRQPPKGLGRKDRAAWQQAEMDRIHRLQERLGEPFTRDLSDTDEDSGPKARRPPGGMSRRDRKQWRMLEAARVHRLRTATIRTSGPESFRGGFIKNPPHHVGRKARRAWLEIERESTQEWWKQRRASNQDIQARTVGAGVIAVVLGVMLVVWLIFHHGAGDGASAATTSTTAQPAAGIPAGAGKTSVSAVPDAAAGAPVTASTAAAAVPVTASSAVVSPTATFGPAGEPGRNGTLGSGWNPTPAGGVAPITPASTTSSAIPASAIKVSPAPTGSPVAGDYGSPVAVTTAWLARTCPSTWTQPYGAGTTAAKPLVSDAAWTVDDPARDGAGKTAWQQIAVAGQQTRRCGDFTVHVSAGTAPSSGSVFVLWAADRVVTSDRPGIAPVVEKISGVRQVSKQTDGRWLVGPAAAGG